MCGGGAPVFGGGAGIPCRAPAAAWQRLCRAYAGGDALCHGRRAHRGAGQPHCRGLPHGEKRSGHEPAPLVLLLGPCGGRAVVHRVFSVGRHRTLADPGLPVGGFAAGQCALFFPGPHPPRGGPPASAFRPQSVWEKAVLAASADDGLRRSGGAGHEPVGVRLCGIRSRGEQNDRRFGRPLRLCAFDGHLARALRKIQRALAAACSNDGQRRNVHRLLRHSVMERLSRARAGGLCTLRVFGRHLLARHIQYGGACDSGRRDGDVRADGAGG